MSLTKQRLVMMRGDDTTRTFTLPVTSDVDLETATAIVFTTRCNIDSDTPIWERALATGITVIDALTMTLTITAAMWDDWESADEPSSMVFDIQTTIGGLIVTRAKGVITVEQDVTHA